MNDQIVCPHCSRSIPLSEAVTHQLKEKMEIEKQEERNKLIALYKKRLEEEKQKIEKTYEEQEKEIAEKLRLKVRQELELKMKDQANENEEMRKQNKQLSDQILELTKGMRQMRTDADQARIEMEKKLSEEQDKIRGEEQKRLDEEYRLRIMEKDKKLNDAMKMVEDYKRKLEQGSQQLQGEVLELDFEEMLKREFPFDEIMPVAKGVRGGDLLQVVKNNYGRVCGSILWELKRTKAWSNEWVGKLKDDQRSAKADVAVLVSQALPNTIKLFGTVDGIWVGEYGCVMGLAIALRSKLIEVMTVKLSTVGKNEKMEVLYTYLSGVEFKQRVEAIVETFTAFQFDIEREKQWFTKKWAKQEKNIRKVIDNTLGLHGDLQSIMGRELGEIRGFESLPESTTTEGDGTLF